MSIKLRFSLTIETAGHAISDHYVDANKMVSIDSGTEKDINDFMLNRFACYLIAQNGDPKKDEIAFAQNYFAVKTRKFEIIEQRIKDWKQYNHLIKKALML